MTNTLQYNYRVRNTVDICLFGKGELSELKQSPFSLPPKNDKEFSIIERPKVPGLDAIMEKYLDNSENNKDIEKNKTLFKRKKG